MGENSLREMGKLSKEGLSSKSEQLRTQLVERPERSNPGGKLSRKQEEIFNSVDIITGSFIPEDREQALKLFIENGAINYFKAKYTSRCGEMRTGLFSARVIEIGGEEHVIWTVRDISTREPADDSEQDSDSLLSDIINFLPVVDFLPDATIVINHKGEVIAWNKAAEEITGIKARDILGKGNHEYSIPFYGTRKALMLDVVLNNEKVEEPEYSVIERKGHVLIGENFCPFIGDSGAYLRVTAAPLYDMQGNIIGAIETIRDITARRQAEEDLQFSQQKFSRVFNSGPSIMAISDVKEGQIFEVNDNFCSFLGYTRQELVGKTSLEIGLWANPADRERFKNLMLKNGSLTNMEFKLNKKNGEEWVGLVSAELLNIRGEQQIISTIVDITKIKQFQNDMARLDQLNMVGEIAASIGHEIRNPLTSVRGFLQLLREKDDYLQDREYFDIMIEEIDRANTIISEFLSLAKNRIVRLEYCNLNDIIKILLPLIRAEATAQEKHIDMQLQEIPNLLLDRKEIRQLILNLVRNGLEAMKPGKKINIKTHIKDNTVVLSIQDEGAGIQKSLLDKINQPFFTTKEDGTGLGLPICYSIAARHNASIHIETSNTGTVFSVRFNLPFRDELQKLSHSAHNWAKYVPYIS